MCSEGKLSFRSSLKPWISNLLIRLLSIIISNVGALVVVTVQGVSPIHPSIQSTFWARVVLPPALMVFLRSLSMPWMCIEQGWAGIPFCLKNSWEIPTNLQIFKRLLLTPWMCNRGKLLLRSLRIPWKRSEGNFLIKIIIQTSKDKLLLRILSMCSEGYYQLFSRSLSIPWMCSEGRRRQCCYAVKWSVSWQPACFQ